MKSIVATSLIALGLLAGPASARDYWTTLNETAPKSVFDQIQESAPRSVFDDIPSSAPRWADQGEILTQRSGERN